LSIYSDFGWYNTNDTDAHSYLLPRIIQLLEHRMDKTILDVGCGNGATANRLIKMGYNVWGIDASDSGVVVANKQNPGRFFIQDITSEKLPDELKAKKFDIVISTEVIEHLYAPRSYINLIKGVLNDSGGELIISTPYHGYLKNIALALSGKMDAHFTVLWEGGHIKFWSRKTLTDLLEEFDFKVLDFYGCGRLPYFWKSMLIRAKLKQSTTL